MPARPVSDRRPSVRPSVQTRRIGTYCLVHLRRENNSGGRRRRRKEASADVCPPDLVPPSFLPSFQEDDTNLVLVFCKEKRERENNVARGKKGGRNFSPFEVICLPRRREREGREDAWLVEGASELLFLSECLQHLLSALIFLLVSKCVRERASKRRRLLLISLSLSSSVSYFQHLGRKGEKKEEGGKK